MKIDRKKMLLCMANSCMNLKDLVEQSGMPYATVKGAVYGRRVRLATIGKIAKTLGVKVEEIVADDPQD